MENLLPIVGIVVAFVACAAFVALVIIALVQVARTQMTPPFFKLLWVLLIVLAPFVGSLVWFGFGKQISDKLQHVSW